jgi:hypothetical protein
MDDTMEPDIFRAAHRLEELARRVPRQAWPFFVLAGIELGVFVVAGNGSLSTLSLLMVTGVACWPLLPAAVIIGCPTAWQSARGVLVGAIVWTTVSAAVSLVWRSPIFLGSGSLDGAGGSAFHLLALAASLAGPAIVAVSLERRRRTSTTWPVPLVVLAVVGAAAACLYQGSNALDWYNAQSSYEFGTQDDLALLLQLAAQTLQPLMLLTLGALVWSSLSASRAGEEPRRFWLAIAAGSTTLFVVLIYGLTVIPVISTVGLISTNTFGLIDTLGNISAWASVASIVLLLVGFGFGLPADPTELVEVAPSPEASLA